MTELKNATEGLNSPCLIQGLDEVKAQINKLKEKAMEITHTGQQDEKRIFKRRKP